MAFLSSLTGGHELIFSRRAHYITTKPPSRFGGFSKTKSNKGPAEVQLWQKGHSIRLLTRWDERVEDKWISRSVQRGGLEDKKDSNRACLPSDELDRGRKIDMANLIARDPKEKSEGRKTAPMVIAFDTVRGEISKLFSLVDACGFLLRFHLKHRPRRICSSVGRKSVTSQQTQKSAR